MQVVLVIGAVWTHALPSSAMLAAHKSTSLAVLRKRFVATLEDMLATLIVGPSSRPARLRRLGVQDRHGRCPGRRG
ncbi:hypothetical protein G3I66_16210 [Streptomyces rubrogriseus]|uniref:Tetracyclin repressor-like C-terminal domain-containing protein n=1 Tax=Streptomyces rubrogriseus TaxID=194673 RepID=A0A6G3TD79_9ACTN|nr:hypothetical protein [Streptomyces rubrogriseus]